MPRPSQSRHSIGSADVAASELASEWTEASPDLSRDALLDVLTSAKGCPLCVLTGQAVDAVPLRMLEADRLPAHTVRQVGRSQGLCRPHTWWLVAEASSRKLPATAVSRALADVLGAALAALSYYGDRDPGARLDPLVFRRTVRHAWTKDVARRLAPGGPCPLCLLVKRIQETRGHRLFELMCRDDVQAAYTPQSALCLPHFRWALDAAGDKAVLDRLVSVEKLRLEWLVARDRQEGLSTILAHVVGLPPTTVCM